MTAEDVLVAWQSEVGIVIPCRKGVTCDQFFSVTTIVNRQRF
jgi:hypothetical protein